MSPPATADRRSASRPAAGVPVAVAIALAALAGTVTQLWHGGIAGVPLRAGDLDPIGGLLAAASAVPLLAWRVAPGAVFAATAAAATLLAGLGYPVVLAFGPAAALYLLAATRDEQRPWTPRSTAGVVAMFGAFLAAAAAGGAGFPGSELLHTGLAWAVAWFAGERTRLRREHLADLSERALRAERDGERERRLAVAEERARIARDLHDAAGHAINVIPVRAGTARMRKDPTRSQAALEAIEASDLTLVSGDLRAAADAIRLSRRTLTVIKQNLAWAFGYNVAAIPLAAAGLLNPLIAGAAMVFSSLSVVSNSLRLRTFRAERESA